MNKIYFDTIFKVLEGIDDSIYKGEKVILCGLLFTMAVLSFFVVTLRFVFNKSFAGCDDLLQIMVLWCAFMGASIGARSNRHINMNMFPFMIKGKVKALTEIFLFALTGVIAGVLAWSGYRFVVSQFEFGEDLPALGMKIWIFQVILPYTFAMVSFRYFWGAVKKIVGKE